MTRLLINEGLQQKAEEDLLKLMIGENLQPESFYYSPYILRMINEKLLETGISVGLGEKTDRNLIDTYWKNLTLPIDVDVIIRRIDSVKLNSSLELIVLIKDDTIRSIIWDDLYSLKKMKPRNERVFRGTFSQFGDISIDEIFNQLHEILEKNSINFEVENYVLKREQTIKDNILFESMLSSDISFSCLFCNMCELPSNYSVNPIPNRTEQPFQELFTEKRICFPSNLASLSLDEGIEISSVVNKRIEEFCYPVIYLKNKSGDIIDFQLALRQNKGVCVFQDSKKGKCTIHESKPLSCFSYPFMIHKVDNNHFTIEVDFSCPGIREESQLPENQFMDEILRRISEEKITDLNFKELLSLKWDLSEYYRDGERVLQDEINEATNFINEEYSSMNE
ncbi:MAG: YkgJ family cysteine cluster protein [Candidatus Heimdallarchaeota archaeon]|nr:YkgJ family cysteine cluster protein [Candidatus Heimdallarchaeota archaeon]MCG3255548.1 YkgJ family cysteine cluster protein [Candidatus Heimdallarchaeota archaeon]MCK4610623.1 YkgJ family cysteine cluster protein [Candidatus Heimdallarchaeota archaeon]